jgi:putative DNA primase/helicase
LAQLDPHEAADVAYLLSNGCGKARMTRGISAKKTLFWNILYVSSGELTLAEHARTAGFRIKGGAEIRQINITADAGAGMGLFEDIHGAASPDAFARQLTESAKRFYGTPLRTYLECLTKDLVSAETRLRSYQKQFIEKFVPAGASGEVSRAAIRFALIAAAGELATEFRITGWQAMEAAEAAERCFRDWVNRRGTIGGSDMEAAVGQVRAFLEAHGSSRFQRIRCSSPRGLDSETDERQIVRDRAGFRRCNSKTGETEYLIFSEAFRNEVCRGYDYHAVAKELDKRRFLLREPPNMTIKPRLPGLGSVRVYGIRAAILEDDEC